MSLSEIERIMGIKESGGCPVCKNTRLVDGKDCPRCFDPARADVPSDVEVKYSPVLGHFRAVARAEDVPTSTF